MEHKPSKSLILLVLTCLVVISTTNVMGADQKVNLYLFWGDGCPHCTDEKVFLNSLSAKYPELEIKDFEIYDSKDNAALFQNFVGEYNVPPPLGVPATFVGGDFVVGFMSENTTGKQIESMVQRCIEYGCEDKGGSIVASFHGAPGFMAYSGIAAMTLIAFILLKLRKR